MILFKTKDRVREDYEIHDSGSRKREDKTREDERPKEERGKNKKKTAVPD